MTSTSDATGRPWRVDHRLGASITVSYEDCELLTYVYASEVPQSETPKPYIHPLNTFEGKVLTLFRPHDHPWHAGMTVTMPEVGGWNFWGGNTYVPGQGYVQLENNGSIEHVSWDAVEVDASVRLQETLHWRSPLGEVLLAERRCITVHSAHRNEGRYVVDVSSAFGNVTRRTLTLETPATKGLTGSGYWGLHWRGSRELSQGRLHTPGGPAAVDEVNGRRFPWIAYTGDHDEDLSATTLVFEDRIRAERFPTQWFAMADSFPSITASFVCDEPYVLAPGAELELCQRVIVACGALAEEEINALVLDIDRSKESVR